MGVVLIKQSSTVQWHSSLPVNHMNSETHKNHPAFTFVSFLYLFQLVSQVSYALGELKTSCSPVSVIVVTITSVV